MLSTIAPTAPGTTSTPNTSAPSAMTIAVTAIGSADSAQPVVQAITLPLSFISGVYIPSVQLPAALGDIARVFPLQHLVAALSRGFLPGATGVAWGDLAILAAWGLGGLAVALTRFRWAPAAVEA